VPQSVEFSVIRFLVSRPGLWINGIQQGPNSPLVGARITIQALQPVLEIVSVTPQQRSA
jgi:hypothetical protein